MPHTSLRAGPALELGSGQKDALVAFVQWVKGFIDDLVQRRRIDGCMAQRRIDRVGLAVGEEHPEHGCPTYLNAIRVLECAEGGKGGVPSDF